MTRAWTALWLACAGCGRLGFGDDGGDGSVAPGTPAAVYASAVLADAPVAYFHLDETGGASAASAVGSVTGQYQGTFGFSVSGAIAGSRAVTLDGMTSRIELGDEFAFSGTAAYSLELWVKVRETAGTTRFLVDRRTTAMPVEGYTIYLGDTYLLHARYVGGIETSYVNVGAPPLGRWLYVVLTWDGATPRMYLDGALLSVNAGGASTIGGGPGNFAIGDKEPGQFYKFDGDLDEIAIYDHALTEARIAAHYAAAK